MVGCVINKSLSLHLVFVSPTTRQLVISILHIKTARKHSCGFPQRSWGGQLNTALDIHIRFVWEIRKECVENRLARKKKGGLGWLMHYHLPTVCCLHDSGQDHRPAARTVLYNHVWQPVRHPVISMAAALALCNHIWLWQFGSKSLCTLLPTLKMILPEQIVWSAGVAAKKAPRCSLVICV